MPRYAALLRGVSPLNCKMPALARCFEALGFDDVETMLASGNVVFSSRVRSQQALERTIERGTEKHLGRTFQAFIRSVDDLRALVDADPFARFQLDARTKRVVTFLRAVPTRVTLPIELRGARILAVRGREVLTAYERTPGDPAFMQIIEDTFGTEVTTRSWDTVVRLIRPPATSSRSSSRARVPRRAKASASTSSSMRRARA